MGTFKIEIEAVGGHGCDRDAKAGEVINSKCGGSCPDCRASRFVEEMRAKDSLVSATLTHWPDTTPIVDDLKAGRRAHGDFKETWQGEPILQFFEHCHLPPHLAAVSKPFCHAAFVLVRTLPRNAERTVALRKLLESKDAAVRALLAK
jgi:hypothetical protein